MSDKQTPPAQAITLVEQVTYADDAIVSKMLLKQEGGTVTLFAFDQDQELSEHTTPFDAMVEVLEGEVELIIGGQPVRACAGQMVIMPADVPHAVRAAKRFKMLLTMLRA